MQSGCFTLAILTFAFVLAFTLAGCGSVHEALSEQLAEVGADVTAEMMEDVVAEITEAVETVQTEAAEGEAVPDRLLYLDFTAQLEDGREVRLSDYIGSANLVVNFWTSWCGVCGAAMPDFMAAAEAYRDRGVTFLMVNGTDGYRETKEIALAYLEAGGLAFDHVLFDVDMNAMATYGVTAIPATLFIDKDGYILGAHRGPLSEAQLAGVLDAMLMEAGN